ncbi:MAG: NAD-dependent dehydratase [Gammaproteobacteria bacterium]|nr:NAD-dependent dehydratase [Gammaproteobacteria bacterium]RPG99501.1 MAG: NAD-dependent epimerase/dehydratase family protein [Candidatus Pelagibacter sp. TMED118]
MTILVTGAAGLLGSELTRQLLDRGEIVIGLDNYYTGSKSNIDQFFGRNGFYFVQRDVRDSTEYPRPMGLLNPLKQIYNLACPASPVHYQTDPWCTLMTNIDGVRNMLSLSLQSGSRMLQASTSEVYGDPLITPQKEEYWGNVNALGPRACYDEGKRVAETMCTISTANTCIARIFNTYGPGMALNDGRAISNFIIQALQNKPITMHGDGKQTRSFCYVEDTASGLIELMNSDLQGPVNIGNPDEIQLIDLAEQIIDLTNSTSEIVHQDSAVDDPQRRCPDISQAIGQLAWSPTVDRQTGLERTIEYIREKLCEQ